MHQSSFLYMTRFRDQFLAQEQGRQLLVADLGSYDVNGSYRVLFDHKPWRYLGLDVGPGPNVDLVLADPYRWRELTSDLVDVFISGQAFEHIEFFWLTLLELSRVLKPGGLCCLIAPSGGPEHRFPVDCWRFYKDGMRALVKYAGLEILDVYTGAPRNDWGDDSNSWRDSVVIARQGRKNRRRRLRELCYYHWGVQLPLPIKAEMSGELTDVV
ncbi:MAG: methyltransferase domain-containing protein [Deltaproteobacteria bacterium]|nr:methyltransferase domain-containing protein [Deltaproteobacteria bacterium]